MDYIPSCHRHTTENEIAFLRQLEREGKRTQLRAIRKALPHRNWDGEGMEINRSIIAHELDRILGRESAEEKRESYEAFVGRVATEWLGGGNLRRITQQRAVADERDV